MRASIGVLAALAATAAAETIVITAGEGGFVFSPETATAKVNDVLEFHFVGSIHTAVQGSATDPCSQSSGGFDSGSVTAADIFQVTVTSLDPIYFFCVTPTHCQGGMVGIVNPATSNDITALKSAAAGTSSSSSSGTVAGGKVLPVGSSGSSSSSSAAVSSSTSTTSTAATSASSTLSGSSSTLISSVPSTSTTGTTAGTTTGTGTSPTGGTSTTSSPTPATTGGSSSLAETGSRGVLLGLVLGLGAFVALMA